MTGVLVFMMHQQWRALLDTQNKRRGWCHSLSMQASFFGEYPSIFFFFFSDSLHISERNTTKVMLCIIMRVWTECALKPVPLEVAQGHRKTEISAVSHWGCPHQRASQLVYLHSHLQSLMKGSPQGGIFPEASGFIKVKNSLRLSIKDLRFIYCPRMLRVFVSN